MPAGARSRSSRRPSRSSEETGSSNQLTPSSANRSAIGQGLLAAVGAVGVDEQLGLGPDRLAGGADPVEVVGRMAADLHLDPRDARGDPAAELLAGAAPIEYDVNPPLP